MTREEAQLMFDRIVEVEFDEWKEELDYFIGETIKRDQQARLGALVHIKNPFEELLHDFLYDPDTEMDIDDLEYKYKKLKGK